MSPQFRATSTIFDNTPFAKDDNELSVTATTRAATMKHNHDNTDSTNNASPANSPQSSDEAAASVLKRSFSHILPSTNWQPLLSLHGSAVSSGMRGGSTHAPDNLPQVGLPVARDGVANTTDGGGEPCAKKAKSSRQATSHLALVDLANEVVTEAPPSYAPPRLNESTQTTQLCHDKVHQLQDMAFPSLPRLPTTVSSCSFPATSIPTLLPSCSMTEGVVDVDGQDLHSYGWFIFTDANECDSSDWRDPAAPGMFLPDSRPDLPFKMVTAPSAENQELVVQQALAADTIDDVLGDLF